MFELNIKIKNEDLQQLHTMHKKIALCRPPSYQPEIEENKWNTWPVWACVVPKPLIKIRWEEKYRIFASDIKPDAYREINREYCYFTQNDIVDKTLIYTFTDYYTFLDDIWDQGEIGSFYAKNASGINNINFGMSQAVDVTGNSCYEYLPCDTVPLANNDIVCFSPYKHLTLFMKSDFRPPVNARNAGVVSAEAFHLDYKDTTADTFTVTYNMQMNRFEMR